MDDNFLIKQQIEYYRARANEYDEWFLRKGRYYRGEEHRKLWFSELDEIRENIRLSRPEGSVLELACGTGLWTGDIAGMAGNMTAVDVSPEAIEINRQKNTGKKIEYMVAELFQWRPDRQYDYIFFGFWLSHLPQSKFNKFWKMVAEGLSKNGQVFFVDSLFTQDSTATNHARLEKTGRARRKLNDGREFEIVKQFYDPVQLYDELKKLGWDGYIRSTKNFFLYGNLRLK